MSEGDSSFKTYLMLFYTSTIWGLNVVFIKMLTNYFDELLLSALRIGVAAIGILAFILIKRGKIPRLSKSQFLWLSLAGVFMIYSHQITLALGLKLSTGTNGSLILALNPLLSVFLAAFFYKEERLTAAKVLGVFIGLFGVLIVILNKSNVDLGPTGIGDVILFISTLSLVIGGLCIKKVSKQLDPITVGAYTHILGAVMIFIHCAFTPSIYEMSLLFPGWFPWVIVLISGLASTALGNVFWNVGITNVGISKTTVFLNWLPISGLLFSALFLGETIRVIHFLGLILVLVGVYLGISKNNKFKYPKKEAHLGKMVEK